MRFITGSNMPGFMPDETPSVSDSWDEAVAAIREDITRNADEDAEGEPERAEAIDKARDAALLEIGRTQPGTEFNVIVNGRAYFVAEHEETYRTRWTLGADPDGEGPDARGPWSFADAKRDLASLIEEDHESAAEAQVAEYGDSAEADRERDEALAQVEALTESQGTQTVTFMSRGFHISRVEEED